MQRFAPHDLQALAARIVQAAGAEAGDADILAEALVDADCHGTSTHGLTRLAIYVKRMGLGLIDPRAPLRLEKPRPAVLLADANNGIGQVQASKALDALIDMARAQGAAVAVIRNSQHFGALSYYCRKAVDQNMALLAFTNCEPSMAPHGGREPMFGTNPIGAAFPTGKGYPLSIDLATSIVARGNIIAANKEGREIPADWALDSQGRPTTDPAAALQGVVLTMAGHKGSALALMVELLAGVLSGAAVGPDVGSMYRDLDRPQNVGHCFILFDIAAFMDLNAFLARMDAYIDKIKQSAPREGVTEILAPGERSVRRFEEALRSGVALPPATLDELRGLCAEFGLDYSLTPLS